MNEQSTWRASHAVQYVPHAMIEQIICGYRAEIVDLIATVYSHYYREEAVNPDTYSLKFPARPDCRINALPAYVGRDIDLAGIKWVGSFPENVNDNLQRASALIILNSFETGYPVAVLDGKRISSARTAASAALAARQLGCTETAQNLAVFGAGVINKDVVEFLVAVGCEFEQINVLDPSQNSRDSFGAFCGKLGTDVKFPKPSDASFYQNFTLGLFGTSTLEPWYDHPVRDHQKLLHVSLRDIKPDQLRDVRNIVDDIDHALKANTSLDLLRQKDGSIESIENFGTIIEARDARPIPTVVSAFGMGMLDVALAGFILDKAEKLGMVRKIEDMTSPYDRWVV